MIEIESININETRHFTNDEDIRIGYIAHQAKIIVQEGCSVFITGNIGDDVVIKLVPRQTSSLMRFFCCGSPSDSPIEHDKKVHISGNVGRNFQIHTTNSDIKADGEIEYNANIQSIYGNIKLNYMYVSYHKVKTKHGNIVVSGGHGLRLCTNTGNIIIGPNVRSCTYHSRTGAIKQLPRIDESTDGSTIYPTQTQEDLSISTTIRP